MAGRSYVSSSANAASLFQATVTASPGEKLPCRLSTIFGDSTRTSPNPSVAMRYSVCSPRKIRFLTCPATVTSASMPLSAEEVTARNRAFLVSSQLPHEILGRNRHIVLIAFAHSLLPVLCIRANGCAIGPWPTDGGPVLCIFECQRGVALPGDGHGLARRKASLPALDNFR